MADQLKQLLDDYRSSYTVPKHPKSCPECNGKVGVYHMNLTEAVFLCSNSDCIWPLATHEPEEILGFSDVEKFVKYSLEKRKNLLNCSEDFDSFQVPQLLSPCPATPLSSHAPATPVREDGDEFVKPSTTLGTPRRQAITTPIHSMNFMPLPALLSPLPRTPASHRGGGGSERSVNIDDDFQLTDTEVSDIEFTPRHVQDAGPDMPDLMSQQCKYYSKDLSQLEQIQLQPKSPPMKIMLKRNNHQQWNVQNHEQDVVLPDRPALSGKQPVKLDKVVLNLKKSVGGGNTWKITDDPLINPGVANAEQPANLPPKEERRGRKSKVAPPMKIQKGETFLQQQQTNTVTNLKTTPVLAEISENSRVVKEPEKSREIPESPGKPKEAELKPKVVKTFSRKTKPNRAKFEAILPAMPSSSFNEDSINLREMPSTSFETNWKEVAELTSKAASALQLDNNYNELSHLMKAATGSRDIDLNFVKQIQSKLSINNVSRSGLVTFFVNRSKSSIDLPTEDTTMSVSETDATIQVRLSSLSDGIVGDVLKTKEPIPQLVVESKRKGRPKNVTSKTTSRMPDLLPLSPSQEHVQHQHQAHQQPAYEDSPMDPNLIRQFRHGLDSLMQTYDFPPDWAQFNIDPHVAMMVTRSQDPAYATVNFEAMIQVYASILKYEKMLQQQQVNAGSYENQGIDLTTNAGPSLPMDNPRTYAELQPVRNVREVTSATQLLHQHHQQEEIPAPGEPSNPEEEVPQTTASGPSSVIPSSRRPILKQEPLTPTMPNASDVDSINLMSVRPQPPSVSMVSGHMASQMEGKHGKIGQGDLVVSFNYRSGHFGPIYANSDEEVKAIVALTTSKVEEREYRDRNGGRRSSGVYASAAATRARSMLPPDVISYLDRAFTKRGMKENIVGRKRRNYPQRSKIIRKDPATGRFIYPNGEIVLTPETIKSELESDAVSSTSFTAPTSESSAKTTKGKDERKMTADIEEILSNTQQALSSPDVTSSSSNEELIRGKISTSLFGGKRRRQFAALEQKQRAKQQKIQQEEEELEQKISSPKVSTVPQKNYARRKRQSSEHEKAAAAEMIESLLANGFDNNPNADSTNEKVNQHGFNTRRNSVESNPIDAASNNTLPALKRYFNPQIDANENKELFVRDTHKDKVRKFLEKKKKKEEKEMERKLKKMKKTSSKNKYKGMGQDSVSSTLATPSTSKPTVKRFTKAQKIGGRKMVLKQSGQVVDVQASQETEIEANKGQLTQDERDLMEKLLSISDSLDTIDMNVISSAPPGTSSSSLTIQDHPDFLSSHDDVGPHALGKDFSSLDDLLC